jgi:hypothetical protein
MMPILKDFDDGTPKYTQTVFHHPRFIMPHFENRIYSCLQVEKKEEGADLMSLLIKSQSRTALVDSMAVIK